MMGKSTVFKVGDKAMINHLGDRYHGKIVNIEFVDTASSDGLIYNVTVDNIGHPGSMWLPERFLQPVEFKSLDNLVVGDFIKNQADLIWEVVNPPRRTYVIQALGSDVQQVVTAADLEDEGFKIFS